jgi:hypothetical protein
MTISLISVFAPARRSCSQIEYCRSALQARCISRRAAGTMDIFRVLFAICMFSFATTTHAADELDLEGATITGNQELPKALHIVPWKSAEAGDLAGRPLNSLVDEILAPIDRDVFLRELEYYEAVHSSGGDADIR